MGACLTLRGMLLEAGFSGSLWSGGRFFYFYFRLPVSGTENFGSRNDRWSRNFILHFHIKENSD
jgi:hypothetical protein